MESRGNDHVTVVITTYDHAHYLADALNSVAGQSRRADEIIVVDDGSQDNPAAIVENYPDAKLLRTANQGLAAARNFGAAASSGNYVIFLDADDVLLPDAISAGLECMQANPGAGFVYGAFRFVDDDLKPTGGPRFKRAGPRAFHAFQRDNLAGMHGAVLYDRQKLLDCGGFDPAMKRCEDYDLYLRMAAKFRVACHPRMVADYRLHKHSMSQDALEMLSWTLEAHRRNRPSDNDRAALAEWHRGKTSWKKAYAALVWKVRPGIEGMAKWKQRIAMFKLLPAETPLAFLRAAAIRALPIPVANFLRKLRRRRRAPGLGRVDMGDLVRIKPISDVFGFDRGTPIDRHYILDFLSRHAADITGHALEIGDAAYCEGLGTNISQQEILHVSDDVPGVTIVGDLATRGTLEGRDLDCIVLTQTLHLIYDMAAAVAELKRGLRPGGIVLATVPGISPLDKEEWAEVWYWSLTQHSALRLFSDVFGPENVEVKVYGNAFSATCFLQGLAQEEIGREWLEPCDPSFPVTIAIRARRAD